MALSTVEREIAHLFRRAGFGATRADIATWAPKGRAAAVDHLVEYDKVDNSFVNAEADSIDPPNNPDQIARWWLVRLAHTKRPLEEKMTLFWHDHWACGIDKVERPLTMLEQNKLFRQMALPNWRAMCEAVAKNPAMLIYLDNYTNRKQAPNENFAREFCELHTLGEDVLYKQPDVVAAARAFTGWSLDFHTDQVRPLETSRDAELAQPGLTDEQKNRIKRAYYIKIQQVLPTYKYNANQHDEGEKTFLGRTGNLSGGDVIDVIIARQEAANLICGKLYNWFVADGPVPSGALARFTRIYFDSGYDLKPVVRAILLSDEFWDPRNMRAKTKSPSEYVAGMARQLEAFTTGQSLASSSAALGQTLFFPPNPAGWAGGKAWINAATILARSNSAATRGSGRAPAGAPVPGRSYDYWDPMPFITASGVTQAGQIVDLFLDLLVDGVATSQERNVLNEYMHTDDAGSYVDFVLSANSVDKKVRGLVFLILASPAYHLA